MNPAGFLADGHLRLFTIVQPAVREQVRVEYAERLAQARTWWQRWQVQRMIRREIFRRTRGAAPPWALY